MIYAPRGFLPGALLYARCGRNGERFCRKNHVSRAERPVPPGGAASFVAERPAGRINSVRRGGRARARCRSRNAANSTRSTLQTRRSSRTRSSAQTAPAAPACRCSRISDSRVAADALPADHRCRNRARSTPADRRSNRPWGGTAPTAVPVCTGRAAARTPGQAREIRPRRAVLLHARKGGREDRIHNIPPYFFPRFREQGFAWLPAAMVCAGAKRGAERTINPRRH